MVRLLLNEPVTRLDNVSTMNCVTLNKCVMGGQRTEWDLSDHFHLMGMHHLCSTCTCQDIEETSIKSETLEIPDGAVWSIMGFIKGV